MGRVCCSNGCLEYSCLKTLLSTIFFELTPLFGSQLPERCNTRAPGPVQHFKLCEGVNAPGSTKVRQRPILADDTMPLGDRCFEVDVVDAGNFSWSSAFLYAPNQLGVRQTTILTDSRSVLLMISFTLRFISIICCCTLSVGETMATRLS